MKMWSYTKLGGSKICSLGQTRECVFIKYLDCLMSNGVDVLSISW